ncbi:MAG: tetratricopeptide (TPR) repeat protein [Cognaticolwellia sp.]|jgi:tetratricopeptide (TPR) repeat protein
MRRPLALLALGFALSLGCGGALNESTAQFKLQEAMDFEDQGAYEQALMAVDAALGLEGLKGAELAEAYTIRGNILNELDRLEEAVSAHQASLALDPDQANVWTNLGVVYRLQGDYESAQESYEKAMALDPTYPELYASLGSVLLYQGDIKGALKILDQGVLLGDDIAVMHSNRAVALAYDGRSKDAAASLVKAERLGYPNGESVLEILNEVQAGGDPMGILAAD